MALTVEQIRTVERHYATIALTMHRPTTVPEQRAGGALTGRRVCWLDRKGWPCEHAQWAKERINTQPAPAASETPR
jgi:hypothetical protein